jgi:transposase
LLIDIVQKQMQVLNKKEKKQLVIELYRQNKTVREIAKRVHISFGDIGKIIRSLDDRDDDVDANDLKTKSKDTKALHLLSIGKTPLDVAIG